MKNSLKRIRNAAGLTMKKLSQVSGVALSTIGNFEIGRSGMSEELLEKLAEALGVSAQEILTSPGSAEVEEEEGSYTTGAGDAARNALVALVGDLPTETILSKVREILADENRPTTERIAIAQQLLGAAGRKTEG